MSISANFKKPIVHFLIGAALIILLFLVVLLGFYLENTIDYIILIASSVVIIYIITQAKSCKNNTEKNKLYVFLLFLISAIFFWALYFIGPMALIYFLKNNVKHTIGGYDIPPQWFMNFDTLMIIIFSPILAYLFQYLRKKE